MTGAEKRILVGMLIVLACVMCSGGLFAGWNIIKQIVNTVAEIFKAVVTLAMQFPNELGVTDWLWTRGVCTVIAILAVLLTGYAFSRKEKKKLLGVIGAIISSVFTILAFA